jgi:hypothetical protein
VFFGNKVCEGRSCALLCVRCVDQRSMCLSHTYLCHVRGKLQSRLIHFVRQHKYTNTVVTLFTHENCLLLPRPIRGRSVCADNSSKHAMSSCVLRFTCGSAEECCRGSQNVPSKFVCLTHDFWFCVRLTTVGSLVRSFRMFNDILHFQSLTHGVVSGDRYMTGWTGGYGKASNY